MTVSTSNPIDAYIGSRLRLRRLSLACSQADLATAAGLTKARLSRYERGAERIAADDLYRLADKLNVPASFFFDGLAGFLGLERPAAEAPVPAASHLTLVHKATSPQESLELIRAFARIGHPELRRRVFDLIKAAGQ